MATQRYISTSFWDDAWVQNLDPLEKLFYIYLLTNPLTTIAGVYKITDRRVSFDCGFSNEVVTEMWSRFTRNEKAVRHGEWVIIPAWPKHQRYETRSKIRDGIDNILKALPHDVIKRMVSVGYEYDMESYGYHRNYSDSDTDTDTDLSMPPTAEANASREVSASTAKGKQADPLAQMWEDVLTAKQPSSTWGGYGKERAQCKALASRTRELLQQTPYETEMDLIKAVIAQYDTLKRRGRNEYWTGAPWTPSALIARWSAVWDAIAKQHAADVAEVVF